MDFYDAVRARRTVRDFQEYDLPQETLERILDAGLRAPSNNHLRQWEFIVIRDRVRKQQVLERAGQYAATDGLHLGSAFPDGSLQQKMYADAGPKQYTMLLDSACLILPVFKAAPAFFHPVAIHSYNSLAAVWCCIENILLAAAAEGLGCALRIPVGDEGKFLHSELDLPEGYIAPCYLGIGLPAEDAVRPAQVPVSVRAKLHTDRW